MLSYERTWWKLFQKNSVLTKLEIVIYIYIFYYYTLLYIEKLCLLKLFFHVRFSVISMDLSVDERRS